MELLSLESKHARCTLAPSAGGRVFQLEARSPDGVWVPLLLAPDDPETVLREPTQWGAFPMVPWPNRIGGGTFRFDGRQYHVPPNLEGNAIHGVGFDRAWKVESAARDAATLSIRFDDRWPFGGRAVHMVHLLDDGIELRLEIHAGGRAFPAGVGWHPWFRREAFGREDVRVCVHAGEIYEHEAMIPTGALVPVFDEADLRGSPVLGDRRLDTCYRHPRGPLRIRWGELELTMTSSPNVSHAVVYTPARGVCVEPQTCAVDAFNLDVRHVFESGTVVVEPGSPLVATTAWRWSWRPTS